MKSQEEVYFHYSESIQRLNIALSILKEIKKKKVKGYILSSSFQFALIEYSKPFINSEGICDFNDKQKEKYSLRNEALIPVEYSELHKTIIKNRNKIYAHDDLSVKEAKAFLMEVNGSKILSFSQNYIHGLELLPRMDEIMNMIKTILLTMYKEVKKKEDSAIGELA